MKTAMNTGGLGSVNPGMHRKTEMDGIPIMKMSMKLGSIMMKEKMSGGGIAMVMLGTSDLTERSITITHMMRTSTYLTLRLSSGIFGTRRTTSGG